ncbi:hypothetical protein ABZ897_53845 [Nonomuraea sp. NPDC046802]|uniref:hypothetical protein n=1 Tax=Nonomuraea sp. NPDC046802 TaxID=3154919 RepID=UPI00340B3D4E
MPEQPPPGPTIHPQPGPEPVNVGAVATIEQARTHLRHLASQTKTRSDLAALADDPSLKLTDGGLLLIKTNSRRWRYLHAPSGLWLPDIADSEWGGARAAAELARRYEAILCADKAPIQWADPALPQQIKSWRSDLGETLGQAMRRVKGEWDAANNKNTTAARAFRNQVVDPHRANAPEGKAYGDHLKPGMTIRNHDDALLIEQVEERGVGAYLLHFENDPEPMEVLRNVLVELAPDVRVYDATGRRRGVVMPGRMLKPGDWVEFLELEPGWLHNLGMADRTFGVVVRGRVSQAQPMGGLTELTIHDRAGRTIPRPTSPPNAVRPWLRRVVRLDRQPDGSWVTPIADERTDERGFTLDSVNCEPGDDVEVSATVMVTRYTGRGDDTRVAVAELSADDGRPVSEGTLIVVCGTVLAHLDRVLHLTAVTWRFQDGTRTGTFRGPGNGASDTVLTVRHAITRRSTAPTAWPEDEQISVAGRAERVAHLFHLDRGAVTAAVAVHPPAPRVATFSNELKDVDEAGLDRFAAAIWLALRGPQRGQKRDTAAQLVALDLAARRRGYRGPSPDYVEGRRRALVLSGKRHADAAVQGVNDEQLRGLTDVLLAMRERDSHEPALLARALAEVARRRVQRPVHAMTRDELQTAVATLSPALAEQTQRLRVLLEDPGSSRDDVSAAWKDLDVTLMAQIAQLDADEESGAAEWAHTAHEGLQDWMRALGSPTHGHAGSPTCDTA